MSGDDSAPLVREDRGDVAWLWFNRPEVHNAQNTAMLRSLADELDALDQSPSVRAVVLAGKGPSFCSGHDLKEISTHSEYSAATESVEGRIAWEERLFVRPVLRLRDLHVPTICRVQGACLAAGLMFASVADFVIATPDAKFGSPIIPAMSINDAEVPAFAWLVGTRRAKQALWLGEHLDAAEAEEAGLVNWVVGEDEIDSRIDDLAARLERIPRETLALSKLSLRFFDDQRGWRSSSDFHFLSHSLSHHTTGAAEALRRRMARISSGRSAVDDS